MSAQHTEACSGCDDIGGCYKCGAVPFCSVINPDGFCTCCGADQGTEEDMETLVRRDLRAIKGIRPA